MNTPPNTRNPWVTLNTKILQRIIRLAQYTPEDDLPEDNLRPARPYLGRVCQQWHATITTTPSSWTNIPIYIDHNPRHTAASLAQSPLKVHLSRSASHLVTVYIVRKVKVPQMLDEKEKNCIQVILSALAPHSARIAGLFIEANTSSSLPSVLDLLSTRSGFAFTNMKSLMTTSNCDDSHILPPPPPLPLCLPPLPTTSLTYLNIDGRNLFLLINPPSHPFQKLAQLEALCVNHLTPRVDGFSMALVDKFFDAVTTTLPKLRTLGLDEFEVPPNTAPPSLPIPLPQCPLRRLVVRKAASPSMQYIFQRVSHLEELVLIGCFFNSPKVAVPKCGRLVIERSVDFDLLPSTIQEWDGPALELRSCKTLDDTFFVNVLTATSGSTACLANLETLKILDCPSFSAKTIINCLELRRYVLGHAPGASLLDYLEVSGRSPKLENDEQLRAALVLVSTPASLDWLVV